MLGRVELKNETSDVNYHQKKQYRTKMQKCRQITKGVCKGLRDHCDKKKKINLNEILNPPLLN